MFSSPEFWNRRGLMAWLLSPASALYAGLTALRSAFARPYHSALPVICVGNITVGGTGKTPLVSVLCTALQAADLTPVILSRGYGGRLKGPVICDPALHDASDIGDEALMLSDNFVVVVAADRAIGAQFIERQTDADVIIMDDGMQNPWLAQDMKIAVFDGQRGTQNGMLFPAGPLRQSLSGAIDRLDAVIFNGADDTSISQKLPPDLLCIEGRLEPDAAQIDRLAGKRIMAFAGIGNPVRFFRMLEGLGVDLVKQSGFADHHPYSAVDLDRLFADAQNFGAELVTTRKDWIRLPPDWRERVSVIAVTMQFQPDAFASLLARIHEKIQMKRTHR